VRRRCGKEKWEDWEAGLDLARRKNLYDTVQPIVFVICAVQLLVPTETHNVSFYLLCFNWLVGIFRYRTRDSALPYLIPILRLNASIDTYIKPPFPQAYNLPLSVGEPLR